MKKSQLRNIIKESIKELMNEQYNPPTNIDPACMAVVGAINPGPPPVVSQNFINNMQNRTCDFYNNKLMNFYQKSGNLMTVQPGPLGGVSQPCLIGDNPAWQAQITHKINYIQNNFGPGTSMNCTQPPR